MFTRQDRDEAMLAVVDRQAEVADGAVVGEDSNARRVVDGSERSQTGSNKKLFNKKLLFRLLFGWVASAI